MLIVVGDVECELLTSFEEVVVVVNDALRREQNTDIFCKHTVEGWMDGQTTTQTQQRVVAGLLAFSSSSATSAVAV